MHKRVAYLINKCLVCGKDFNPFRKEAKYCSLVCRGFARRQGRYVHCSYCKRKIYRKLKDIKLFKLFYCSNRCHNLDQRYTNAILELKEQARDLVLNKIRKKELKRERCHICGKLGNAHHYLGYEREHWLDIEWLCRSHHSLEHQKLIRIKNGKEV